MKPSERIGEILKRIVPPWVKEGATENVENATILMGYGIQGIMDYLDEEHKKKLAEKSVENCYLEYNDEGILVCSYNHKDGEECVMIERY